MLFAVAVPTVTDRFVQQAIAQVLTPIYEEQFHEYSYGFRPNRCAQQAVLKALDMMNDGSDWIVDIDLEKFFDTVNHDSSHFDVYMVQLTTHKIIRGGRR